MNDDLPEPDARGLGQWVKSIALKDCTLLTHDGQWWTLRRDGELIRYLTEFESEFIDAAVAQRDEQIAALLRGVEVRDAMLDERQEDLAALRAEVEALRAVRDAASDAAHAMEGARVWDGMKWHYNPLHPIHYRPALEKLHAALDAARAESVCPDCNGTGDVDSGGIHPWGAPAYIACHCPAGQGAARAEAKPGGEG